MLSKLEELVLLTVLKLGENAYGITIYKYMKKITGKKLSVGSVYFPLERLAKKGYLSTRKGEPTPKRGGMSKKYYRLNQSGIKVLKKTNEMNQAMWHGIEDQLDGFVEAEP